MERIIVKRWGGFAAFIFELTWHNKENYAASSYVLLSQSKISLLFSKDCYENHMASGA